MRMNFLLLGICAGIGAVHAGSVTGTVRDAGSGAVAGVNLFLTALPLESAPCGFGDVLDSALSGGDGGYALEGAPGFYALRAEKAGSGVYCGIVELTGNALPKDIGIAAASNSGATFSGVAFLDGSPPVRAAGVRLILVKGAFDLDTLETDANGEIRIEGVAAAGEYEDYIVQVRDERFRDRSYRLSGVSDGQVRTIRMALEKIPGSETEAATLSGIVLDAHSGIPVIGATVYIMEVKTGNPRPLKDSTLTNATGRYRFSDLVPIDKVGTGYVLLVKMPRYASAQSPPIGFPSGENPTYDFKIGKILSLTVRVREADGSQSPLKGAQTSLTPGAAADFPYKTGGTEADGRFTFDGLAAGEAGLTVALKGYLTLNVVRNLDGIAWDESLTVALKKDPGGGSKSIQGTLRTRSGKDVPGNQVFFKCASTGGTAVLYGASGPDGIFAIEGIPGECPAGVLILDRDSSEVTLPGPVTQATFVIADPPIGLARRQGVVVRVQTFVPWFRNFNLLGRKIR